MIRGDVWIPDGPPPRSAVVVVHGFKGFRRWGFFPHLCQQLAGAGHAVVIFDFSRNGVGDDGERFTELGRFAANTLSMEQDELRLMLGEVLDGDLLPRPPRALGLVGHSRGGGQAILAAAAEARVGALVTWAAVSHFDRWAEETRRQWREDGRLWILNQRTGQQMPLDVTLLDDYEANAARLDVSGAAARVASPWLIVHGDDDATVPFAEAEALARAQPAARVFSVADAGHTLQAVHPLAGTPDELRRAVGATLEHLGRHLET